MWTLTGGDRRREPQAKSAECASELQIMLPTRGPDALSAGDVCLLAESPYRILRVSLHLYLFAFLSSDLVNVLRNWVTLPFKTEFKKERAN